VGHTRVPTITPLYQGRVIAVQVYPKLDSFGNPIFEALLIRDGVRLRALPGLGYKASAQWSRFEGLERCGIGSPVVSARRRWSRA